MNMLRRESVPGGLRRPEDDEMEFKKALEEDGEFCVECGRSMHVPAGALPLCPTSCFRKRYPQLSE